MPRIITANLNGIRSATEKGFFAWLCRQDADYVCLQELKAHSARLAQELTAPCDFHVAWSAADRPGYSGVAILSRQLPTRVHQGIGSDEFDREGRLLRCDFPELTVLSLYLPSGSSSQERQQAKFRFMEAFLPLLRKLRAEERPMVICGDWNIAHRAIDLCNWKSNQKNSGFLPEERAWMDQLLDTEGWMDVYRHLHPDAAGDAYTWWSNRGRAREKNVGWRIDYHIATPGMALRACNGWVYTQEKFSDHAPLVVDYTDNRTPTEGTLA